VFSKVSKTKVAYKDEVIDSEAWCVNVLVGSSGSAGDAILS